MWVTVARGALLTPGVSNDFGYRMTPTAADLFTLYARDQELVVLTGKTGLYMEYVRMCLFVVIVRACLYRRG